MHPLEEVEEMTSDEILILQTVKVMPCGAAQLGEAGCVMPALRRGHPEERHVGGPE